MVYKAPQIIRGILLHTRPTPAGKVKQIPDMLSATQTNLSHRVRDVPLHNMQMLEKQNTHTVVTFTVRAPSRETETFHV